MNQIFSLKVSNSTVLIQQDSIVDDILFISKVITNNSLSELRIQRVYETKPELRLNKLIRKQQFQEAEKFAKMFSIDPVIILKAKAELYVEKSECTTEDIVEFLKLLDLINDDAFKLSCCSTIECGSLEDVKKILVYGTQIIPKDVSNIMFLLSVNYSTKVP